MTAPTVTHADLAALREDIGRLQSQLASLAGLVATCSARLPEVSNLESQIADLRAADAARAAEVQLIDVRVASLSPVLAASIDPIMGRITAIESGGANRA